MSTKAKKSINCIYENNCVIRHSNRVYSGRKTARGIESAKSMLEYE